MTWTAPITFVSGSVLTASQMNTYLRDNMQETMPAKATTAGSYFVTVDRNQIEQRAFASAMVSTSETSTSLSFVDLATVGPTVTVKTATRAFVFLYCHSLHSTGLASWMSYDVSGATDWSSVNSTAKMMQSTGGQRTGASIIHQGLTPGMNTFVAKYRVSTSGTGTWSDRRIAVMPF